MLEKNIQQKIIAKLKGMGYLCAKVDGGSSVGWLDLIAVSPDGVVYFFEVKTETGRLSKMQSRTIKKLRNNHANVAIVHSVEETLAFINRRTN